MSHSFSYSSYIIKYRVCSFIKHAFSPKQFSKALKTGFFSFSRIAQFKPLLEKVAVFVRQTPRLKASESFYIALALIIF